MSLVAQYFRRTGYKPLVFKGLKNITCRTIKKVRSRALFLMPKLPLCLCWVVLYSCCTRVILCCTRAVSCCTRVIFVLCRVASCCYSCGFLDQILFLQYCRTTQIKQQQQKKTGATFDLIKNSLIEKYQIISIKFKIRISQAMTVKPNQTLFVRA